jgi:hypothetical protein
MNQTAERISVTDHALARWRQRGAAYADAPASDCVAAVRCSRPVADGEPLPAFMADRSGFAYLFHEPSGCYFVAKPGVPGSLTVVSVLRPGFVNYLRPKRKKKPAAPAKPPRKFTQWADGGDD